MGRNKNRLELFTQCFATRTDEEIDLLTHPEILKSAVDIALTELSFLKIERVRNVNGLPLIQTNDSLIVVFINVDDKPYSRLNDIGQYAKISDELLMDRVQFLANQYNLNPIRADINLFTHIGKVPKTEDGYFRSNVKIINSLGRMFYSIKLQDLNPIVEEVVAEA